MIIPFETGIPTALKEVGFNEPCWNFFINGVSINAKRKYKNSEHNSLETSAPDYDQVIDWFEREYRIIVYIVPIEVYPDVIKWEPSIYGYLEVMSMQNTRYEALNEGIKEAIKLIRK